MRSVPCPSCGAPSRVEDLNLSRRVARCPACREVFRIPGRVAGSIQAITNVPPGTVVHKSRLPLSDTGNDVEREAHELVVALRRTDSTGTGDLLFALGWLGMGTLVLSVADVLGRAFGILMLVVGLLMARGALIALLNVTTVRIGNRRLVVRHAPIPTFGHRDLPVDDVLGVDLVAYDNDGTTHYALRARLKRGNTVELLRGLTDPRQAQYLERMIELHLGIDDGPSTKVTHSER